MWPHRFLRRRSSTGKAQIRRSEGLAEALSAEQPPQSSEQPIVVDRQTLRRMIHDEVARQIQEFVAQARHEQQQHEAAARLQSACSMASILRSQLALYRLQHHDRTSSVEQIGDGFKLLTLSTNAAGQPFDGTGAIPPYVHRTAVNPLTGKSKVGALGKATAEDGWSYDPQTGALRAVLPGQLKSRLKDQVSPRDVEFAVAD